MVNGQLGHAINPVLIIIIIIIRYGCLYTMNNELMWNSLRHANSIIFIYTHTHTHTHTLRHGMVNTT